jgi:hypothetical protein
MTPPKGSHFLSLGREVTGGFSTTHAPCPELDLDRLFLMRLARRVRKDATISLGGALWEVPTHLRGLVITLHFDPIQWTRVEVWLSDRFIGNATRRSASVNRTRPVSWFLKIRFSVAGTRFGGEVPRQLSP